MSECVCPNGIVVEPTDFFLKTPPRPHRPSQRSSNPSQVLSTGVSKRISPQPVSLSQEWKHVSFAKMVQRPTGMKLAKCGFVEKTSFRDIGTTLPSPKNLSSMGGFGRVIGSGSTKVNISSECTTTLFGFWSFVTRRGLSELFFVALSYADRVKVKSFSFSTSFFQ